MTDTPSGSGNGPTANSPGGQPGRHLQIRRAHRRTAEDPRADTDGDPDTLSADRPARTHSVTADEVLAHLRAQHRAAQASRRIGAAKPEPEAPSPPNASKMSVSFRCAPLAVEMTDTRAATEGVSRNALIDEFLIQYGWGVPEDPDLVASRQRALFRWFIADAGRTPPPDRPGPRLACDVLPPALLERLRQRAEQRGMSAEALLSELLDDD